MQWAKASSYSQVSDRGYRVSACKIGDAWLYVAWSAPECPELGHWKWRMSVVKPHYERGEPIPQRCQRLGQTDTAAAARSLCEAHASTMETGVGKDQDGIEVS